MCEHYVARAAEPFRLDELWPFTERLERFGIAGFGWGAAWLTADGGLASYRDVRAFRDDPGRERVGAVETTSRARPPAPAVAALDADAARHPAVRRPGRPVRVQPQRRPPRLPGACARRTASRAGSTAAPTPRWAPAGSRTRGSPSEPVGHLLGALHDRFGGQANLAVLPPTARRTHYAGNGENPVFSFRLGRSASSRPDLLARPVALPVRRPPAPPSAGWSRCGPPSRSIHDGRPWPARRMVYADLAAARLVSGLRTARPRRDANAMPKPGATDARPGGRGRPTTPLPNRRS